MHEGARDFYKISYVTHSHHEWKSLIVTKKQKNKNLIVPENMLLAKERRQERKEKFHWLTIERNP